MKCRNCRRVIEDNSIFCNWCGTKQIKEEAEIRVPRPRLLKGGQYTAQIMVNGERYTVTKDTETEYYAKARALKAGLILKSKLPVRHLLGEIIDKYIENNENVLSPSTIRGYTYIRRCRFKPYVVQYIDAIPWQQMINEEALLCSPKTLANAWGLVASALRASGYAVPDINLPNKQNRELNWLDYEQIQALLSVVEDEPIELPVLLALHSLRLSELLALDRSDITDTITINKSIVMDKQNCLVTKTTTKTTTSTRVIPVFIPRLYQILPETGRLVTYHPNSLHKAINSQCRKAGVPAVGVHGLRRSFASLGYHLKWSERSIMAIGGWSNIQTVHRIYVKLAQKDIEADVEKMRNYYGITDATPQAR